jgi:restriction system protein
LAQAKEKVQPMVPTYQQMLEPILRFLADDGQEHSIREVVDNSARQLGLTQTDLDERLSSGQTRFKNRVGWARTHLKAAELFESPSRGRWRITPAGLQVLASNVPTIDQKFLQTLPAYQQYWKNPPGTKGPDTMIDGGDSEVSKTPLETLIDAYESIREATRAELLARLKEKRS